MSTVTKTQPANLEVAGEARWHRICDFEHLIAERGVSALVAGQQVAVFRTYDDRVFAIGNIDPFTGAAVLSRGIVGSRGPAATVASPLHKQVFELATGRCLDEPGVSVPSYRVRVLDRSVEVHL